MAVIKCQSLRSILERARSSETKLSQSRLVAASYEWQYLYCYIMDRNQFHHFTFFNSSPKPNLKHANLSFELAPFKKSKPFVRDIS